MKKSVLIIEDDKNIADAQKLILEEEFDVHQAFDGDEGLRKARELKPDLIILDLMLPKVHGMNVCREIKKDSSLSSSKIVMVTAKNEEIDELKGMNIGADDYIMKPFEAEELKHVINQVLK